MKIFTPMNIVSFIYCRMRAWSSIRKAQIIATKLNDQGQMYALTTLVYATKQVGHFWNRATTLEIDLS